MKKIVLIFASLLLFNMQGFAHSHHHGSYNYPYYNNHSSHSESVYLTHSEYKKTEKKFPDCDKHYMEIETTINTYSDGSRRTYSNITIFNSDGSVLVDDCRFAQHVVYNDKHYFLIRKYKEGYKIIDSDANILTDREYSFMDELESNRILVKYQKKFGVIDLNDNIIIPLKYQKFKKIKDKIFLTKLNGYWGIIDIDNVELIKNDCEKITLLFDTLIVKRYGKYGLANLNGYIFMEPVYDNIKKYNEYILVKKDDKYGILDYEGKKLSELVYKKIKVERNTIKGQFKSGKWVTIKN